MVDFLPDIHPSKGICERCVLGKHPQEKFNKGKTQKASFPLDLIHRPHGSFKGPMRSLWIRSKGEEALWVFPVSNFSWGCFPRTHPSQIPLEKWMSGRPSTNIFLLRCHIYMKFKCLNLSWHILLLSSAWVSSKVESSSINSENVYNLDWWFTSLVKPWNWFECHRCPLH